MDTSVILPLLSFPSSDSLHSFSPPELDPAITTDPARRGTRVRLCLLAQSLSRRISQLIHSSLIWTSSLRLSQQPGALRQGLWMRHHLFVCFFSTTRRLELNLTFFRLPQVNDDSEFIPRRPRVDVSVWSGEHRAEPSRASAGRMRGSAIRISVFRVERSESSRLSLSSCSLLADFSLLLSRCQL